METSLRMRLDHGLPLTPKLLGFTHDEDGKLIPNPETYKIPKLMFYMCLYGYSMQQIAEKLRDEYGLEVNRATVKRNIADLIDAGYDIQYTEVVRTHTDRKTGEKEEKADKEKTSVKTTVSSDNKEKEEEKIRRREDKEF